jgi:hypothetical protein
MPMIIINAIMARLDYRQRHQEVFQVGLVLLVLILKQEIK